MLNAEPENVTQLKSYLGMFNYYHRQGRLHKKRARGKIYSKGTKDTTSTSYHISGMYLAGGTRTMLSPNETLHGFALPQHNHQPRGLQWKTRLLPLQSTRTGRFCPPPRACPPVTCLKCLIQRRKKQFWAKWDRLLSGHLKNETSQNTIVRLLLLSIIAMLFQVFSNVSLAIYKWGEAGGLMTKLALQFISLGFKYFIQFVCYFLM